MAHTLTRDRRQIADRIVRFDDLKPCYDAFIDTRTPGSDQKENFTIIGPGVSENLNQHVHIAEPHGFNIGGARQPPGCTNSQHSHDTAEVFYVHSGTWRVDLGEHGEDAQAVLREGDLISIPTRVFRGFTNVGEDVGFLWAVLGGDDPGRVLWAPQVFDMATEYGLVLMEDGMLVDTAKGEVVPKGKRQMPVTTREQCDALQRFSQDQTEACVVRAGTSGPTGPFDAIEGVAETYLIGAGRLDWPHGFRVSEIAIRPGAAIPDYILDVPDVWFVQAGEVICAFGDDATVCGPGDTVTFPRGETRSLRNDGDVTATLVAVRGGDEEARIALI
ncbi:MAG: cupin domain-containing protein [Pseudomonadota bacterium]